MMKLLSRGGIGTIYQVNAFVAVKSAPAGEELDHAEEQFTSLAYISSLFRVPKETFLELLPTGDLTSLFPQKQTINPRTHQILTVKAPNRWNYFAAEGDNHVLLLPDLRPFGLRHCDILPVLDSQHNVKLIDFGRSITAGDCDRTGFLTCCN